MNHNYICDFWRLLETFLIRKYSRLALGEMSEVLPFNNTLPEVNPIKIDFLTITEAYLKSIRTSTLKLFCKNC